MRCNPIKSLTFNTIEPLTKPYVRNIIRVTTRQRRKISFEEFANLQALCQTKNQNEIQKFVQNKYGCPRCQCCCFTLKPQFQSSISCNNRPSVLQLESRDHEQSTAFFPVKTNNQHTPNPSSQVESESADSADPTSTSVTDKTKPSSSYHGAPKAESKSSTINADRSARHDSSATGTPNWLIAAANALFSQGSEKPGVAIPDVTLKDQIFQSLERHRSILIPILSFLLFILFCLLVLSLGLPLRGSNENEYYNNALNNSASLMNDRSTERINPHLSNPTNQKNPNLPDYYKNTKGSGSTDSDSKVTGKGPETNTEEYGKLPLQLDPSKLSHTGSSMHYRTEESLQQVDDFTEDSQTSSRANKRMSPKNRNQNNNPRSQDSLRKYISSAAVALFGSNPARAFAETSTSNSDEDCTSKCSCETGHCVYSKFY